MTKKGISKIVIIFDNLDRCENLFNVNREKMCYNNIVICILGSSLANTRKRTL